MLLNTTLLNICRHFKRFQLNYLLSQLISLVKYSDKLPPSSRNFFHFYGIDVNKTSQSKEGIICHKVAILNLGDVNYRCIINRPEAVNLLQNTDLNEKRETL